MAAVSFSEVEHTPHQVLEPYLPEADESGGSQTTTTWTRGPRSAAQRGAESIEASQRAGWPLSRRPIPLSATRFTLAVRSV
jgi:hypothetical protein